MSTAPTAQPDAPSPLAAHPLLEAISLHRTFRSGGRDLAVLRGVDLQVARGEWLAVLGRSGSGKSTLLHLLGGLDRPRRADAGHIHFDGQPLGRSTRELARYRGRHVGFVFQQYHLLPELDARENVIVGAMAGDATRYRRDRVAVRRRAVELLERVGLGDRLGHRPNRLSGGERQRVAIARALVNEPELLLADEPTGNLDAETAAEVMAVIAELHQAGQTIVMVTHDDNVANTADRRVTLVRGHVED